MNALVVENNSLAKVLIADGVFEDDIFFTNVGGEFLLPTGMILSRNTATSKLDYFLPSGAGPAGTTIPVAVLACPILVKGSGIDIPMRALVSGVIREDKLSIITLETITQEMKDLLRDFTLVPVDGQQLNILDNQ